MELREYQRAALNGLYEFWGENPNKNPLIVLPTGAGKSLVIAKLIEEVLESEPSTRIVQVTHVKELIQQNYNEFVGICPDIAAGVYSAGIGRREASYGVTFAGIQTAFKAAHKFGHVDLLVIDECHLVPPDSSTMYGKFIDALRETNPNLLVLGLTATPFRLDAGRLDEGEDRLFDQVVAEVSIRDLMDLGFLTPLISKATATQLDVTGVARRGGDFVASALQAAIDKHATTKAAVDEIVAFGKDRRGWLAFCAGVDHAHHVAGEVRNRGFTCEAITGDMDKESRARILSEFKAGNIRCLTNANVLTTGFNAPHVDLLAMLRPTESTSLYVQMVGRGTRCVGPNIDASIAAGKANCLVLDFAGNVRRHGPVDDVKVRKPGAGAGDAPVKECPECHSLIFAGLRECPDCGHIFERDVEKKLTKTAAATPILSQTRPEFVKVKRRTLRRHEKPGARPSIAIEYLCGMVVHKEWVCPEHDGYARLKFEKWWREHGGPLPFPETIDETLERVGELRETDQIRIKSAGRYWEVTARIPAIPTRATAPTLPAVA